MLQASVYIKVDVTELFGIMELLDHLLNSGGSCNGGGGWV